ncbi:hypothetical protein QFZ49_000106 [Streptomyces turgidiscabies]|uniref:Proteasome subunit beta n=1 Tax=Streptomyces turgidiscabies TaxID=85558 RepID=A0ABU0RDY8_9ACTN|nr:hypothetical protein [Streptomyces turgidiscabies]
MAAHRPELLHRDDRFLPPGVRPDPHQFPHGTTVLALTYRDGVLLAGDRRATMGNLIAQRDLEKVHPADAVRNQGKDIVTAVTDLYNGGGGLRRFQRFWDGRFNGNAADAKFLAHNILTAADDKEVVAAQLGLVTVRGGIKTLPAMLSYDELERLEQGFVDTLLARTGQESRMAATYRRNHDTYLRAARARAHKE